MRRLSLAATAVSILLTGVAAAADLPAYTKASPPPAVIYDWTGFYLGANAGGIWGGGRSTLVDFTSDGYDPGPTLTSSRSSSWVAGVHGGHNWQTASRIVLGIEGDFEFASHSHSNSGPLLAAGAPFLNSLSNVSDRLNWLASARGRLGYAVGSFMPYITGGSAVSETRYSGYVTNGFGLAVSGPYSETRAHTGWVAGAGAEYMASPNWIFRAEYLHYAFGGERIVGATNPGFVAGARGVFTLGGTTYDTVRAGVSYKFGGPTAANY